MNIGNSVTVTPEGTKVGIKYMAGCFLAAVVLHLLQACAPQPVGQAGTLERNYVADIVACAALAGSPGPYSKEEDLACRENVNCRYGLASCHGKGPVK